MRFKVIIFLLLTIIFPSLVWAAPTDSATQAATRDLDRSIKDRVEKKLIPLPEKIPEIKEQPQKEAPKGPKILIKKIDLQGLESFSPEDFSFLTEKYENREISLEELNTLAKEIQKEYLRKGIISACFIPPQDIKDNVVIIKVIEAKMGKLIIGDHKYFRKKRLNYYWNNPPGEVLRYDSLFKSLQLMNKNSDRNVRSTLHAGEEPETTDVHLDVTTHFPLHLSASFDKEGSISTGKNSPSLGFRYNNFLGWDDSLITGYSWGRDSSSIYFYHTIPISNFGTSILYGYNYGKSFPKKQFTSLLVDSRSRNSSIFLYQDIYRNNNYLGDIYFGLDVNDKTTKTIAGTLSRDRLRILRLGTKFLNRGSGYFTLFKHEISQGTNLFGARKKGPLSSNNAKSDFTKANLTIDHRHTLPLSCQVNVKLTGQLSGTRLTPQEQYYLGGIDSVRGYPSGDYLADNAFQANFEFLFPSFFIPKNIRLPYLKKSLKDSTIALIFFDYGWGTKRGESATNKKTVNFKGIGAGVRVQLTNKAILRLEWGFPVGDDTLTEKGDSRFHFSLDFEL